MNLEGKIRVVSNAERKYCQNCHRIERIIS